jgi:tetratricopeptide (TPR) repeat protein
MVKQNDIIQAIILVAGHLNFKDRSMFLRRTAVIFSCWLCVCLSDVTTVNAQFNPTPKSQSGDKVHVRADNGIGEFVVKGEIQSWLSSRMLIKLQPSGLIKEVQGDSILQVETFEPESYQKGCALLSEGRDAAALALFREAYQQESREWFKLEILAKCINCSLNLGDETTAIQDFLTLTTIDPQSRHFRLIPLCWEQDPGKIKQNPLLVSLMQQGKNEIEKLIGSSYLSLNLEHQAEARKVLESLTYHNDPRIAFMAKVQTWRFKLDNNTPSGVLELWSSITTKAPDDLQDGAYFVLGNAYAQVGRMDQAVECWLRLWAHECPNRLLTKQALIQSYQSLVTTGRKEEAQRVELLIQKMQH